LLDPEPAGWAEDTNGDANGPQDGRAPYVDPDADEPDADPRALSVFREELEPHGRWVDDPRYGTLWVPHAHVVGPHFSPYVSHGRWAVDETGQWVWLSDFSFGRVVFHYGRWIQVSPWGWAWVPGTRYAPAWVVWRVPRGTTTTAYVGWAPAPPLFLW